MAAVKGCVCGLSRRDGRGRLAPPRPPVKPCDGLTCWQTRVTGYMTAVLSAGVRGSGVDPGGVHLGGPSEPSGLGHVRLRLLLRHDLHLDGGLRLWGPPAPRRLGHSGEWVCGWVGGCLRPLVNLLLPVSSSLSPPPPAPAPLQDFLYHLLAAMFYLSASVSLAKVTLDLKDGSSFQTYQLDISAVVSPARPGQPSVFPLTCPCLSLQVFSYVSTLLYFIHAILSAIRWKSF